MINIFLDTNIYLNFYRLSTEDIERLENLVVLIKDTKDIKLYITKQVIDEFYRNRDAEIKGLIESIQTIWWKWLVLPSFSKKYPEYKKLQESQKDFSNKKNSLENKIMEDISNYSLPPDKIIKELFDIAEKIEVDNEIINLAKIRNDLGNPPWKKWSLGDAINWLLLLKEIPIWEDLYFVWVDWDFKSILDKNKINSFLEKEWIDNKLSNVYYHENLSIFLKEKFPGIWELDEYKKEKQIEKLLLSWSFNTSRQILSSLEKIWNFSDSQINKIIEYSLSNPQVYNAHQYSPELIWKTLENIVKWKHKSINPEIYEKFCNKFGINLEIFYYKTNEGNYEEIPF